MSRIVWKRRDWKPGQIMQSQEYDVSPVIETLLARSQVTQIAKDHPEADLIHVEVTIRVVMERFEDGPSPAELDAAATPAHPGPAQGETDGK